MSWRRWTIGDRAFFWSHLEQFAIHSDVQNSIFKIVFYFENTK